MKLPFHLNLENSFDTLKSRFPLQSIIILILTSLLLSMLNTETSEPLQIKLTLTCIVIFFFSTGIRLFREGKDTSTFSLLDIIPFIYGILFYLTVDPTSDWGLESFVYFTLHLTGFLSFTFFAPYLLELFHAKVEKIEYTNYFTRVAWTFLMSGIVGIALLLLGFIAIASVTALFELSSFYDEGKLYGNWAILALALSAPLYGLSTLPERPSIDKKSFEINKFFSFLIRFVATPFIYIYFFILYAYSIKVLADFSHWPKGMISWMVIGFSTFGYLTYIFSLAYETSSRIVRLFRQCFPYVVIPQIGMLAYAIGLRIQQYDLTMNRYFVVVFGLWLLGVSCYFIFSHKKSLVSITASLAMLSLVISVGPWSVYSLPLIRQYDRLVNNLEEVGLMQDGKITVSSGGNIAPTLQNDIYSGIEYVCGFDECSKLKILFPNEYQKAYDDGKKNWDSYTYEGKGKYTGPSRWDIVNAITTSLGISYRYGEETSYKVKYIQFGSKGSLDDPNMYPLDISGYDIMLRIMDPNFTGSFPDQSLQVKIESEEIVLTQSGQSVNFSLAEFNSAIRTKYGTDNRWDIPYEDLVTTVKNEEYEIKIYFQNYSMKNPEWNTQSGDTGYFGNISGFAFIRKL